MRQTTRISYKLFIERETLGTLAGTRSSTELRLVCVNQSYPKAAD